MKQIADSTIMWNQTPVHTCVAHIHGLLQIPELCTGLRHINKRKYPSGMLNTTLILRSSYSGSFRGACWDAGGWEVLPWACPVFRVTCGYLSLSTSCDQVEAVTRGTTCLLLWEQRVRVWCQDKVLPWLHLCSCGGSACPPCGWSRAHEAALWQLNACSGVPWDSQRGASICEAGWAQPALSPRQGAQGCLDPPSYTGCKGQQMP